MTTELSQRGATDVRQSAPAWVLLRGLAREKRHWGDFSSRLGETLGVEVLCPDTPGNGQLNSEASPLLINSAMEEVRSGIGHRGPINLFGLSMGGMIATEWARCYPQEVNALVLVNSSFGNFSSPWNRLWPAAFFTLMRSLTQPTEQREAQVFELTCQYKADRETRIAEWSRYASERPLSRANFIRQLSAAARFRAPSTPPVARTLILNALGDQLVNPGCSQAIAERWGVELRSHPWAGHDLPHDAPDWVVQQLQMLQPQAD
ncbi:alpha/beta fold hydrolase [Marinobacterium sp. YM272]|uniref:alpha/beta fold hydrolase n=1 Tax=Marinobacterium sp. YM272 TaxID=3421654 RepID=UPI003D7F32C8